MRKALVIPFAAVGVVAAGGLAWAALGGSVLVPDAITGQATGQGAGSCQSSSLSFTLPDPTWDAASTSFVVSSVTYSGISTPCVNLGTIDLELRVVNGAQTLASATANNLSSSTGSLTLSSSIEFDTAANADFIYLVKG